MKLKEIRIEETKASVRQAGMMFRRFTHPKSFDGTPETYEANLKLSVGAIKWAKCASDALNTIKKS